MKRCVGLGTSHLFHRQSRRRHLQLRPSVLMSLKLHLLYYLLEILSAKASSVVLLWELLEGPRIHLQPELPLPYFVFEVISPPFVSLAVPASLPWSSSSEMAGMQS